MSVIQRCNYTRTSQEEGFTLIELLVVIVIIGVLAAIALPIFLNQQKAAIVAGMKSDVKNTNTNITTALIKNPNISDVKLLGIAMVKSDPDTVITLGGAWDDYYVHATNKNVGDVSTVTAGRMGTVTTPAVVRNATVLNPYFETDVVAWNGPSTTVVSHETTSPITGKGSLKITATPAGTAGNATIYVSRYVSIPIAVGDTYEVTAKYKSEGTAVTGSNQPRLFVKGTDLPSGTAYMNFPNSTPTLVSATNTTPITKASTALEIVIYGSSMAGNALYVDDITVTVTTPAKTVTTPLGDGFAQSPSGNGVLFSSVTGKTETQ